MILKESLELKAESGKESEGGLLNKNVCLRVQYRMSYCDQRNFVQEQNYENAVHTIKPGSWNGKSGETARRIRRD